MKTDLGILFSDPVFKGLGLEVELPVKFPGNPLTVFWMVTLSITSKSAFWALGFLSNSLSISCRRPLRSRSLWWIKSSSVQTDSDGFASRHMSWVTLACDSSARSRNDERVGAIDGRRFEDGSGLFLFLFAKVGEAGSSILCSVGEAS